MRSSSPTVNGSLPLSTDIDASHDAGPGAEGCSWCDVAVEAHDGYRLFEPAGERRAVFCRLEHVVAWAMHGPHWEAGADDEPPEVERSLEACAHCGAELPDTRVVLVRHRGEHRIADAFCSVDHLDAWARAGGRWR
jgi:hypothetical protein